MGPKLLPLVQSGLAPVLLDCYALNSPAVRSSIVATYQPSSVFWDLPRLLAIVRRNKCQWNLIDQQQIFQATASRADPSTLVDIFSATTSRSTITTRFRPATADRITREKSRKLWSPLEIAETAGSRRIASTDWLWSATGLAVSSNS
jgi:hypothetical protein